jgi:hypothetical protein
MLTRVKTIRLLFIGIMIFVCGSMYGQHKEFGLGIIVGGPTDISAKYWFEDSKALDFGLGYSFSGNNSNFNFHADYLWHEFDAFNSTEHLLLHYGVGVRIKTVTDGKDSFGARGVVGIAWFPLHTPIEMFIEVAPVFKLIPETTLDLDGGVGVRFYF